MPSARYFKIGKFCFRLASIFVWLLLAGCQMLGPTAVGVGRGTYNDVIARSGSEHEFVLQRGGLGLKTGSSGRECTGQSPRLKAGVNTEDFQ